MSKTIKVDKFKAEIEKSIRDALKKTDFIITEIEFHYFLSLFNTYQFIKNYVKKKFDLDFVFQAEFGFKIEDLEEEFKQLHPRVWERHQGELKPLFVLHKFSGSKLDRAYGKVFKIKEWCDGMKKKKQKRFSTIFPSLETQKARMKKSKSPSYAEKSDEELRQDREALMYQIALIDEELKRRNQVQIHPDEILSHDSDTTSVCDYPPVDGAVNSLPQSSGLQNQIHLEEGLSFNNQSLNFDKEKNMINDQENDDILSIERFLAKENDEKSSFDYQSNE